MDNMMRNTTFSKSAATAGVALPASVSPPDGEAWLQGFRSTQPVLRCVSGMLTAESSSSAAGSQKVLQNRCCRHGASLIIWFPHIYSREAKLDVCTGLMCSPANENISIMLIAAEIVLSWQLTEEQLLKPDPWLSWWMNQPVIRLWAWIRSRGLKPSWPITALGNDSLKLTRPQNETGEQTHQTSDSALNCKQPGG